MDRELAQRIIAVINDLMDEATHKGVVQRWDEVNNVLVILGKFANKKPANKVCVRCGIKWEYYLKMPVLCGMDGNSRHDFQIQKRRRSYDVQ